MRFKMTDTVTIKEAASMLGVNPSTLRNWERLGKFKSYRHPLNKYRIYKIEDLKKFKESYLT